MAKISALILMNGYISNRINLFLRYLFNGLNYIIRLFTYLFSRAGTHNCYPGAICTNTEGSFSFGSAYFDIRIFTVLTRGNLDVSGNPKFYW